MMHIPGIQESSRTRHTLTGSETKNIYIIGSFGAAQIGTVLVKRGTRGSLKHLQKHSWIITVIYR